MYQSRFWKCLARCFFFFNYLHPNFFAEKKEKNTPKLFLHVGWGNEVVCPCISGNRLTYLQLDLSLWLVFAELRSMRLEEPAAAWRAQGNGGKWPILSSSPSSPFWGRLQRDCVLASLRVVECRLILDATSLFQVGLYIGRWEMNGDDQHPWFIHTCMLFSVPHTEHAFENDGPTLKWTCRM